MSKRWQLFASFMVGFNMATVAMYIVGLSDLVTACIGAVFMFVYKTIYEVEVSR